MLQVSGSVFRSLFGFILTMGLVLIQFWRTQLQDSIPIHLIPIQRYIPPYRLPLQAARWFRDPGSSMAKVWHIGPKKIPMMILRARWSVRNIARPNLPIQSDGRKSRQLLNILKNGGSVFRIIQIIIHRQKRRDLTRTMSWCRWQLKWTMNGSLGHARSLITGLEFYQPSFCTVSI